MQEVSLREFLRNYKNYLPLPKEGIKIIYRAGGDFYLYPQQQTEADKLRVIAKFLAQEMRESHDQWEAVEPLARPVSPALTEPVILCEAKMLMPWENTCPNKAQPYLVANTEDGLPMGPSDWKTINLCPIHKGVVESMGGYEIETP